MKNAILKIYLSNFKLKHVFTELMVIISVIVLFLFLLNPGKIETSPSGWNTKLSLTPSAQLVSNYSSVARENFIAVAYEAEEKGILSLFVKVSFNSGKDFFKPVKIADANLQARKNEYKMNPVITISSNGKLFLVWQDFDKDTFEPKIFNTSSADGGVVWSALGEFKLLSQVQFLPKIIYDSKNRLHVFYHVFENDAFFLYHIYETDAAGNFSTAEKLVKLTGTFRGAFFPAILSSENEIFIIWQGKGVNQNNLSDDLFFMKSANYGESWTESVKITASPANDASPYIYMKNNRIYCTYLNNANGNWEMYLTQSDDKGKTWSSEPVNIFKTNINCYDVSVTSDSRGNLLFFWFAVDNGKNTIFTRKYMISDPVEVKFTEIQQISENRADAMNPSVLTLENDLICMWREAGSIRAKYSDIYAPPPEVFSSTHPFEQWSKNSIGYINWKKPQDESGIAGYAVIINKDPNFNPTVQNYEAGIFTTRTPSLDDGVNYFHIRAIDNAGNFSRTIHYPLLVSSTPLMMPQIFSSTHKDQEKSDSRKVTLNWSHKDEIRVKGYRYSFALNSLAAPDKFTSDKEMNFDQLPDGRYFFQLQAVDKTNTYGRIATFEIVIGDVGAVDPKIYIDIAGQATDAIVKIKKPKIIKQAEFIPVIPQFEIKLKEALPLNKLHAEIQINITNADKLKGIEITGFSAASGFEIIHPEKTVQYIKSEFDISDLKQGGNYISAIVQYKYISKGIVFEEWTEPVVIQAQVNLPSELSPLEDFERIIIPQLRTAAAAGVAVVILLIVTLLNGFNIKISFYGKMLFNRIMLMFKLMVSNKI